MLLVKTYINKSPIHGIGLFAAEFIPKDTLVWKMSDLDLMIEKETFKFLPETAQEYLRKHGDWDKELQKITMSFDNDKFMNHSFTPNIRYDNQKTFAKRDIQIGEEMTINYYEFDESADDKLSLKLF
jgi:SET domain-containing protein